MGFPVHNPFVAKAQQAKRKKAVGWLAVGGIMAATFLSGAATMLPVSDKLVADAYSKGYKDAVENTEWSEVILSNQKQVSATCNQWWFGMNASQRVIRR